MTREGLVASLLLLHFASIIACLALIFRGWCKRRARRVAPEVQDQVTKVRPPTGICGVGCAFQTGSDEVVGVPVFTVSLPGGTCSPGGAGVARDSRMQPVDDL